jgi:hypothetical protein
MALPQAVDISLPNMGLYFLARVRHHCDDAS